MMRTVFDAKNSELVEDGCLATVFSHPAISEAVLAAFGRALHI